MFDIHAHIIPCIDDGCRTIEQAFKLLKEEENAGVTDLILTPHYEVNRYKKTREEIEKAFEDFKEKATKVSKINLYLGYEVFDDCILKEHDDIALFTINGTKYLLQEFSYDGVFDNLEEILYVYEKHGLKIIIAHVERYGYDKEILQFLKDKGMLFQVNATSVVGKGLYKENRITKWLLKNGYVDFVASDLHYGRENHFQEAFSYVQKKYGEELANKLFITNAKKLLLENSLWKG